MRLESSNVILTESELCLIQQALGLRESIIQNSMPVNKAPKDLLLNLQETSKLRRKIVSEISFLHRQNKLMGDT